MSDLQEIEELRARVAELEGEPSAIARYMQQLGLTKSQARLFALLRTGQAYSRRTCLRALTADAAEKVLDVQISKMRKKIRPFGYRIENIWGFGYRLSYPHEVDA